jgi:hypothetical protein
MVGIKMSRWTVKPRLQCNDIASDLQIEVLFGLNFIGRIGHIGHLQPAVVMATIIRAFSHNIATTSWQRL